MSTAVLSVEKVEFALSPFLIFPPRLMLRAGGHVSTSGWSEGRLEPRFDEDETATLTTLKFEFVATPPPAGHVVSQMLTPLFATYMFKGLPLAATKVVVLAATNQVEIGGIPDDLRARATSPIIPDFPDPMDVANLVPADPAAKKPAAEALAAKPKRQGTGKSENFSFEEALNAALRDLAKQPGESQIADIIFTTRVVSISTFAGGFVGFPLTLEVTVEDTTFG